jgi:rhamnosyltransferase subunit B
MSRIVIVTFGSLGDLHPAIALGLGLQRRGHAVSIATSETNRDLIAATKLSFQPVRPDFSPQNEGVTRRVMDGTRGSEFLMKELVYPAVHDMYADLAAIAPETDLFVTSELTCAAPTLGEHLRARWVYFALSPISFQPGHDPSHLPGPAVLGWLQSLGPAGNRFVLRLAKIVSYPWWKPVRTLRRQLGLPVGNSPLFEGKYSPLLNLALFSPVLQPPQPDWPANTIQAGFVFHDEAPGAHFGQALPAQVEAFLAAGEPPLIFTLGSAAVFLAGDFYAKSAQAAQRLGRRALLLIGKNAPPPNLPASILAWGYLPHAQVFPRGAAIVHQGGVGTTAQALRAGRPMLVMPFAHDQFDNADRVCRLGVARQIARKHYSAVRAAAELGVMLENPRYREKAWELGVKIQRERGVVVACEALERVLQRNVG